MAMNEVQHARRDVAAEARTIEHAIMADFRLHPVRTSLVRNIDAERMGRLCLTYAGNIVVLALNRHERTAADRAQINPINVTVGGKILSE